MREGAALVKKLARDEGAAGRLHRGYGAAGIRHCHAFVTQSSRFVT
jgi:hypothetical protein